MIWALSGLLCKNSKELLQIALRTHFYTIWRRTCLVIGCFEMNLRDTNNGK